jgi:hypothetical protein
VAERADTGEIVKRALAYPYASPERSFVFAGGEARPLRTASPGPAAGEGRAGATPAPLEFDLAGRTPLLAYGANAAPEALARKLASAPSSPLPVLCAELLDFDVVYSAHVSPYGAVPATLHPSPGTSVSVHVIYPDAEQLPLLAATEPNYQLTRLRETVCRVDRGATAAETEATGPGTRAAPETTTLASVDAFLSRHGPLFADDLPLPPDQPGVPRQGAHVALAAIPARNRHLPSLLEPEVLEHVRSHLAPDLGLEQFILGCVEIGGIAPLPHPLREVVAGSA